MIEGWKVVVIIPARDEESLICSTIDSIPSEVDFIVVVNDGSVDSTEELARTALGSRGKVVSTPGLGVGGAISHGYRIAAQEIEGDLLGWAAVVMAGDGQMDSEDLPTLLHSLNEVPFVKGDRWSHASGLGKMPIRRRLGSRLLSTLTALASGVKVRDPQCGFTAVRLSEVLCWDWVEEWSGYGYPNWWILNLGSESIPYKEVPVRSVYGSESSGIKIHKFMFKVAPMLYGGLWKRGWSWYVSDSTKISSPWSVRISLATFWFASHAAFVVLLADAALGKGFNPWAPTLSLLGLLISRMLDRSESVRRLSVNSLGSSC